MALLAPYRVLDLCDERGLLAGRMLADLGADVVQVEPAGGCRARKVSPRLDEPATGSYVWEAFAANKRGVAVDMDTADGCRLVADLAAVADLLIESEGPAVQRRRGLDYDQLIGRNPRLVYVSLTAFGRTGPKAGYAESDLVLWAAGGPLDEHRDGDRPPVRISIPQAYLHASADAAAGALFGLIAAGVTGRGQLVDISVQASLGMATLGRALFHAVGDAPQGGPAAGHALQPKRTVDRSGSGAGTEPALKKWTCRDGAVEFHIGIGPASGGFTNNFLNWMLAEGEPVERFAKLDWKSMPALIESGEFSDDDTLEMRSLVAGFLARKSKREVLEGAMRFKLLCVPIFDTADVAGSEQLATRDFWITLGEGGRHRRLPGPFARMSRPAFAIRRPAPLLGEHDEEIHQEWTSPRNPPLPESGQSISRGRPLDGFKVCDFSWVVAGPLIGRALADFGATVVRVESSRRIETARFMPPFIQGIQSPEHSALYSNCNAGKLGITIDMQSEEGLEVARDLVGWADVVIEAFSPGLMGRWGLDYESARQGHEDLIMLSTSINGQTGPLARLAGYGNIGAALSGFQPIVGWPDRPALGAYGPYTDFIGPRFSLVALLAAVDDRRRTGQGCYLDVAQVEAGAWFQAPELARYFDTREVIARMGNVDRDYAPHGVFPAAMEPGYERSRFVAIAVTTDDQWRALAEVMDRDDLLNAADFCHAGGRLARAAELENAVAAWTETHPAAWIEEVLQARGVPAHRSASSRDFCEDPQLIHRRHLVALPHHVFGSVVVEGPRYVMSGTPGRVDRPAPMLGEHNETVLTGLLGYSPHRYEHLVAAGILV
jgi:crotonobetainyl-CoA:carnitine CoA-transferase CaiB-like acyl-CoA transferase